MKTKTWTCSFLSKTPSGPVEFIKDGEVVTTVAGIPEKKVKWIVNVLNEISSLGLTHFQLRTLEYLIDHVLNLFITRYTRTMDIATITKMTWKSCSNCRKLVYLTEHDAKHVVGCYMFCKCCDIAYYDWKMRTGNVLAQVFLASDEARRARLPRYARDYFLGATTLGKGLY